MPRKKPRSNQKTEANKVVLLMGRKADLRAAGEAAERGVECAAALQAALRGVVGAVEVEAVPAAFGHRPECRAARRLPA